MAVISTFLLAHSNIHGKKSSQNIYCSGDVLFCLLNCSIYGVAISSAPIITHSLISHIHCFPGAIAKTRICYFPLAPQHILLILRTLCHCYHCQYDKMIILVNTLHTCASLTCKQKTMHHFGHMGTDSYLL